MPLNEADIREVVRHTVPEVLSAYGVDVADPQAAQADMAYIRRRREFDEKFTFRTRLILVTVMVSSAVTGLVYLIRQTFTGGV